MDAWEETQSCARSEPRRASLLALAAIVVSFAIPGAAPGAVFDCSAGDVPCLVAAINAANANPDADTINLAAGTYTLTAANNDVHGPNGLPVIISTLTIRGAGAGTTIIERDPGAPDFRIIHVAAEGTLTIQSTTIRNGSLLYQEGEDRPEGGGISNSGETTIIDGVIADNFVDTWMGYGGGGIANNNTLILTGTRVEDNAGYFGGGILNSGTLTVDRSFIIGNYAEVTGGGILGGTVTITNSTIADNVASLGFTGGVDGNFNIKNSLIVGNYSSWGPGGVGGSGTIENSTIARNSCDSPAGVGGGAIRVGSGSLLIKDSTVADNSAVGFGGGLHSGGGTIQLQNTILARNMAYPFADEGEPHGGPDCYGAITSLGHNLVGDPSDCTITLLGTDLTGDPGLGTFEDDGTPGNGHVPLLATSQAIDAGDPPTCTLTDQLGHSRIDGDGDGVAVCDIGSVELSPEAVPVDDQVGLAPLVTAYHSTPVPGGPAGTFSIRATFTNTSSMAIHDPVFEVKTLSRGNLLLDADGAAGGVGARLTPDVGPDAILSPGESLTTEFVIGLQVRASFTFFVELLGVPGP